MTFREWFNTPWPYIYFIGLLLIGFWVWVQEKKAS